MSNIPEARELVAFVRERLVDMGADDEARVLGMALRRMTRKSYRKVRAPVQSDRVTAELKREMRQYARTHPEMTLQHIGDRFNVSGGRVSEALAEE